MNATIGKDSEQDWKCIGKNNDIFPTNNNGNRLLQLCQSLDLYILNSIFQCKTIHRETWYSPTGFRKRIDYIIGDWYVKRFCSNCRVYRKASLPYNTDHRMLAGHFNFPSHKLRQNLLKPSKNKSSKLIPNINLLKTCNDISKTFSVKLDQYIENSAIENNFDGSPDTIENAIVEAIKVASLVIPTVSKKQISRPWINPEYINLINARKHEKDPSKLKILNKSIRSLSVKLKNTFYAEKAKEINDAKESRMIEEQFRLTKQYRIVEESSSESVTTISRVRF